MAEGLIMLAADGRILSINKSASQLLADAAVPPVGRHYMQASRNLDLHHCIEQALAGQKTESKVSLSGRTYQVLANPVEHEGSLDGVIVLLLDITEQAQAEATRREFSANVSHELKSPLTTIAGYAEMMQAGLADVQDNTLLAGKILDEARRLLALIDDIIKLSRLDEASTPVACEAVDLHALLQGILARAAHYAGLRHIILRLEGEAPTVWGVAAMLEEAFHNLIDNAIRYNREGGSVAVQLSADATHARVRITDTGVGIAAEHHARIFERFYRVDKSHSRATGGTGLGLSIVRHIALKYGGDIAVESTPGEGSVFTVKLNAQK